MKSTILTTRTGRAPRRASLVVSSAQSRQLSKIASLLGVKPEQFLKWLLADEIAAFNDPAHGMLTEWVEGVLAFDTPEEEQSVRKRVAAWIERQSRANVRRAGKEGSSP